ncbi:hypothetical protein HaLaN_31894 [Haematococcus lacustris]|uniref:Uncharacterized protein n=1 Tax=Haematococcus lacustris TaxID=44745 RepID=A0A6A0AK60_HAELA|nr:hypothetical protein HaLaN_31894 [Haematococcus lacustris]
MAHHIDLTLEDDMSQEQEEGDEAGLSSLQQAVECKELQLQKAVAVFTSDEGHTQSWKCGMQGG